MPNENNNLGNYLRQLRGKNSLRDISARTNKELSHSYISDLEKGVSRRGNVIKPSPETLQILAKAYNADFNYLMELAGYDTKGESLGRNQKLLAAHVDDNVSEEKMNEIINFIDYVVNRDHNK